jgi:hypothetical protein
MSPKCAKRLRKLQNVKIQEIIDGCLDCSEIDGVCSKHWPLVWGIICKPRQHEKDLLLPGEETAHALPQRP